MRVTSIQATIGSSQARLSPQGASSVMKRVGACNLDNAIIIAAKFSILIGRFISTLLLSHQKACFIW